jgi:hypothetical protein
MDRARLQRRRAQRQPAQQRLLDAAAAVGGEQPGGRLLPGQFADDRQPRHARTATEAAGGSTPDGDGKLKQLKCTSLALCCS